MITSLPYSRRCVLRTVGAGLFGTAATTLIVACSRNQQTHATSDPSVSQYVRSDFSGEVAFESFNTSAGSYVPANAEHPAQNVPVPIKTENMGKNSIAGFYDTIGYLNAALNYLLATDGIVKTTYDSDWKGVQFAENLSCFSLTRLVRVRLPKAGMFLLKPRSPSPHACQQP